MRDVDGLASTELPSYSNNYANPLGQSSLEEVLQFAPGIVEALVVGSGHSSFRVVFLLLSSGPLLMTLPRLGQVSHGLWMAYLALLCPHLWPHFLIASEGA